MTDAASPIPDDETQVRTATQSRKPVVSVVVPTYNRLTRLRQVIAALEQQQFPPSDYEIIVISDGSTDGTDEFLATLKPARTLKWLSQSNKGPAAARNLGISKASGDYIVFVDDDVVAEPVLLAEHMRAHREAPGDIVVLGPLISPNGFTMSPWVRWEQNMLMKQYRSMLSGQWRPSARQFYTGNASVKRCHILAAGGFDESFRRAEDVELAYRLAAKKLDFVFKWEAAGNHYAERSFRSWIETPYNYGRNDIIFVRDRGQGWLFGALEREFQQRNMLIRFLVRHCVDRPLLKAAACRALKSIADIATALKVRRVEKHAYSGIFNLQYYSGLYDELGDANAFCKTGGGRFATE